MLSALEFPIQVFAEGKSQTISLEVRVEDADLFEVDEEITLHSPIRIRAEVYRQGVEVYFTFDVGVQSTLLCGRCLDPVSAMLESRFPMVYRPIATRPAFLQSEEEIGLGYYEGSIIDIREDIRRYLLLEIPLWPVCSEDCKGLCHHCGTNLNHSTCTCDDKKSATRRRSSLASQLDQLLG